MSEWITDREPTADDTSVDLGWLVWTCYDGRVKQWSYDAITLGRPWQPIIPPEPPPEPYVKPKRYEVTEEYVSSYAVRDTELREFVAYDIPTREAAERIAAIYEEVMP